jgi:WD40 repeat protein
VHNGPVTSVGFAPDGSTLVTGGSDGMDLWSAPGLLREGSPFGTAGSSSWYAWFGPGQQIEGLAPSGDPAAPGEVWFTMPGTPAGWAQAACRLTVADMSRDQWRRYVGTRPYQAVCPH